GLGQTAGPLLWCSLCHASFRDKLSRQKLRAAVSEGPVLVRVRNDRHDDVGRWYAARPLQLTAEQPVEGLLRFLLSWPCRDLNDDAFARVMRSPVSSTTKCEFGCS